MASIREFIRTRKAEVRKAISELEAELAELDAAENALSSVPTSESGKASGVVKKPIEQARRKRSGPTIKELVMDVLEKRPEGGDVHQIIKYIEDFHQQSVSRPSLSPQLTRLARDGKIARRGRRWFIPKEDDSEGTEMNALMVHALLS